MAVTHVTSRSVERRVGDLEVNQARSDERMHAIAERIDAHLLSCERRGARLEKLGWATGGIVVAILGVLLRALFHFG